MNKYFNVAMIVGLILCSTVPVHGMFRAALNRIGSRRLLSSIVATSLSSMGLAKMQSKSILEKQGVNSRPLQVQAEVDKAFGENKVAEIKGFLSRPNPQK